MPNLARLSLRRPASLAAGFGIGLSALSAWAAPPTTAAPERGEPLPRRGSLGAQLAPAPADRAREAGVEAAVAIAAVLPGLSAERWGLRAGDLLLEIAGERIAAPGLVAASLRRFAAGDRVTVKLWRDGKTVELAGDLAPRPRQREDGFRVVYDQVVSQGRRIRVVATHPDRPGPHPTVFLIGGIGAYSVDGDFAAVPYGDVLAPLAKAGYASIRIDKPGQGDSEGPAYPDLGFDDERDAYLQALRLAKTLPFVDRGRIAIFGHSMGGAFGPLVAAEEPVAGLAVHGTLGKTWIEYVLENTRRQALLGGASAGDVDALLRDLAPVFHLLFDEGLTPAQVAERRPASAAVVRGLSPDGRTYSGVGLPFFEGLARQNLMRAWESVQAPVLALYGENDFLSSQADHEAIVAAVNRRRPGTAEFVLLAGADHNFLRTTSPADSLVQRRRPGGEFNPNVVDALRTWLDRVLAPKPTAEATAEATEQPDR